LPDAIAPRDDAAAYAVQDEVVRQLGTAVAGWKVGAASPTALPSAAPLLAGLVAPSPASVAVATASFRAAEVELAFSFARVLQARAAPYGEDEVWDAVAACHVAIELLDTRYGDHARMNPAALLADNATNGFFTYGAPIAAWRAIDFATARANLMIDGALVKSAVGGNAAGHPRRLLAWLATHAASRGRPLGPGAIVTTGNHTGLAVAPPGAHVVARFAGLGEATLRLTAA
jgi:2-keto-4-pentenoate hydratase